MVKVEIIESSVEKTGVSVKMSGNPLKCTVEAISIVKALYHALKNTSGGEVFADIFCEAIHDNVFKGDEELEESIRELKENNKKLEEANDFLRKFIDALKR